MQRVVKKLRASIASIGVRDTGLYLVARILRSLFGNRVRLVKYLFVVQPLRAHGDGAARSTGAFDLAEIGPQSELFAQVDRPRDVIAGRFAQGARCLAATVRGRTLAGFLWYVIGPYHEDEVRATFVPEPAGAACWDFDVTIMPAFRMGRLFSHLWRRASNDLASRGIRCSVSRISAFNAASIASHRRLGAEIVGTATFLCVGGWQIMHASDRPRWHVSWGDGRRVLLRIGARAAQAPSGARYT